MICDMLGKDAIYRPTGAHGRVTATDGNHNQVIVAFEENNTNTGWIGVEHVDVIDEPKQPAGDEGDGISVEGSDDTDPS